MVTNTLTPTQNIPAKLNTLAQTARAYIDASLSDATRRAYQSDWVVFTAWCSVNGCPALPSNAEAVAMFVADQANTAQIAAATLTRRCAAIRYAHESVGHESPTKSKLVAATLKGIRRAHGGGKKQKTAATVDKLQLMLKHCPNTLSGKRDRALLLLGFSGAFRRSELAALTVADLEAVPGGLRVSIRKSKTDQEAVGQVVAIYNGSNMQAIPALNDWLRAAHITEGPLFRSINKAGVVQLGALTDKSIANTVKRYAMLSGLNAADFAGHSLRSGFLTSAAEAGASIFKMMEVSRHKKIETLTGYVRNAELFKDHAGGGFL